MPRDKLLWVRFKIQKFKWYLVDVRDYHKPVLVRKHLDSKEQAEIFRDRYYDKNYIIIYWKEARDYDLRDFVNKHRTHGHHTAKYVYPDDCVTQHARQLFRNNERKKMKQNIRLPKVSETAVWEILDDKPVLFVKRVSHYADNHWVYSDPVEGLKVFEGEYEKIDDLRYLCNIVRTLRKYYDLGLYDVAKVALLIYKKWGKRIKRHCDVYPKYMPRDHEKIIKEFKARGFVEKSTLNFDEDEDSFIETIHIKPTMAHPELCWHAFSDRGLYDHYVYDFQAMIGIAGFTSAMPAGLARRK